MKKKFNQVFQTICFINIILWFEKLIVEENEEVLQMYTEHKQECFQDKTEILGWIGVSYYKSGLFISKFYKEIKKISYHNYPDG